MPVLPKGSLGATSENGQADGGALDHALQMGASGRGAVRNAFTDKDWALKFQSRVRQDDGDINLILLKQQLRGFVLIFLVAVWTNDYGRRNPKLSNSLM